MNLSASLGQPCGTGARASHAAPAPGPAMRHRRPGRIDEYTTTMRGMRFALWASQLRHLPTVEQIRDRFLCSKATAYRWRALYTAAIGEDGST